MILELKSIRPMKSMYSETTVKRLRFKDLESGLIFNGYLSPSNPVLFNQVFPTLKVGAHYIGYTWPKRMSIDMSKLTLAAVQPIIPEQLSLFD